MIAPQFDLIIQCIDVAKELPTDSWEALSRPARRSAGLVGRWAIEKALEAAIIASGAQLPKDRSLVNLHEVSGVSLTEETLSALKTVDQKVTSQELEGTDEMWAYLDCCSLARGIVQTVHLHLTVTDVWTRTHAGKKA